jgi:hypothetical protein
MTHVLTVGITAILISGLLIGVSGMVDDQRERAIRTTLETVGERLSTELAYVDEMATGATNVSLGTEHPRTVAGRTYTVALTGDPGRCGGTSPCLRLETESPGVRVVVPVSVDAPISESTVPGGNLRLVYDGSLRIEQGVGT